MSLESEILSDLRQLLSEHGFPVRWKDISLLVLVDRNRYEQQLDIGGFVDPPDLSLRLPKLTFPAAWPESDANAKEAPMSWHYDPSFPKRISG